MTRSARRGCSFAAIFLRRTKSWTRVCLGFSRSFRQAASNLKGVNVLPAVGANVYDILNHDTLILTKAAVEKLEARFNG